MSPAEAALKPVVAALGAYHKARGHYPASLDDLVSESLLPKYPELPPVKEAFESGLEYRGSPSPDFFVITFHYHVRIVKDTYAFTDDFRRVYASDDRRGWTAFDSVFVSLGDLIADRLAPLWRERHDPEILRRLIAEGIGAADCESLIQSKVVRWLGQGSPVKIPPELVGPGKTGFCYQAKGDRSRRYCFVYKKHWFGHFECGSDGAAAKGPLVFTSRLVLDKLFMIGQVEGGKESWELLRACPASELDIRPESGPGRVVSDDE